MNYDLVGVDIEIGEGVDGQQDIADVSVNDAVGVALLEVVGDRFLVTHEPANDSTRTPSIEL